MATPGNSGQLSYRTVPTSLDDLHVRLRALEEAGHIRTRICPTVTTLSGTVAEVFLGTRQFFAFSARTYSRDGPRQEVVLESTDVGSSIRARPWTGDAEHVTLRLRVQANTVLTVDRDGLPLVATRTARGTVRVTSGDTVVLGGMLLDSPSRSMRRAGGARMPVLGGLGRARARQRNLTEALVLVSARASTTGFSWPSDPYPGEAAGP